VVDGDVEIAAIARLLADRTRARICTALLDGRFRTAGELATHAGVAPSTASEHLAQLVGGGLLESTRQGRHRYFRLATPAVAAALESLAVLAPTRPVTSLRQATAAKQLREGRTCYDHLAGRLGVVLTDALVGAGVLTSEYGVGDLRPLDPLGLELPPAPRRPLVRPCLDWTERRHHVAGALPAALTLRLVELDWLRRTGQRAVRLTPAGHDGLRALVAFELPSPAA
jgi:DNA-binding transcriptional ArsR family regulator